MKYSLVAPLSLGLTLAGLLTVGCGSHSPNLVSLGSESPTQLQVGRPEDNVRPVPVYSIISRPTVDEVEVFEQNLSITANVVVTRRRSVDVIVIARGPGICGGQFLRPRIRQQNNRFNITLLNAIPSNVLCVLAEGSKFEEEILLPNLLPGNYVVTVNGKTARFNTADLEKLPPEVNINIFASDL